MDECTTGDHSCDENAACSNTLGSFSCRCNEPLWQGNGKKCYYFDACWNSPCPTHTQCVQDAETVGRYRCDCEGKISTITFVVKDSLMSTKMFFIEILKTSKEPFVKVEEDSPHGPCKCPVGYSGG